MVSRRNMTASARRVIVTCSLATWTLAASNNVAGTDVPLGNNAGGIVKATP